MLEGLLAGESAEVSPTGLPSNKIPKPGGAGGKGRAGDSFATGLQSFMQKVCSQLLLWTPFEVPLGVSCGRLNTF